MTLSMSCIITKAIFFLVLAGTELIFLSAATGFSKRSVLITLLFLVVTKKSRTSFSFLCSANEQMYRSWEGTEPDR